MGARKERISIETAFVGWCVHGPPHPVTLRRVLFLFCSEPGYLWRVKILEQITVSGRLLLY
jgi:hypothetical protein